MSDPSSGELHVFHFSESGYFAARSKERAFAAVMSHTGCTAEDLELECDFNRQVPDDELIGVTSEDSWGDEREVDDPLTGNVKLTIRASEWANSRLGEDDQYRWRDASETNGEGYLFGGSE